MQRVGVEVERRRELGGIPLAVAKLVDHPKLDQRPRDPGPEEGSRLLVGDDLGRSEPIGGSPQERAHAEGDPHRPPRRRGLEVDRPPAARTLRRLSHGARA